MHLLILIKLAVYNKINIKKLKQLKQNIFLYMNYKLLFSRNKQFYILEDFTSIKNNKKLNDFNKIIRLASVSIRKFKLYNLKYYKVQLLKNIIKS